MTYNAAGWRKWRCLSVESPSRVDQAVARGDLTQPLAAPLRSRARRAYYHHRPLRRALGLALSWRLHFGGYDLSHLPFHPEEEAVGPVQRDEALMLFALTRVLRPQVVVEVGFLGGQSAFNFLRALDPDATLYSFDIAEASAAIAQEAFGDIRNFVFHRISQDEIAPEHVDHRTVDLAFLDASHDLDLNRRTFERLAPMLAPRAVLAVHDTGAWSRRHFGPVHHAVAAERPDLWASPDAFEHQRDERAFVDWLLDRHPEFSQIHLHSDRTVRHGTTLLQRSAPLRTGR